MATEADWLEKVMKKYTSDRVVQSLSDVSSEPAVAVGNNFASNINRISFQATSANGQSLTQMSVIVKKKPTNNAQLRFLESHNFFNTEIKLYEELLPKMEEVLREVKVKPLWPALIGHDDGTFVFSDLKRKNYRLVDKSSRLDLEHSILGMRSIAVFHSASIVLKERGQLDVTGLGKTYLAKGSKEVTKIIRGAVRIAAKSILNNWEPQWRDIGERMLKKSETLNEELEKLVVLDENRLNVLNHGDIWITNLMFRYSRCVDGPIDLRFVDFQLSHYNSYAYDLIYFIYTSIPPQLRRDKYKHLLSVYSAKMKECLESYGLAHLAPSSQDVESEMDRLSLYSCIVILCILPLVTTNIMKEANFDKVMDDDVDDLQSETTYTGDFMKEIDQDLLQWAEQGLF